MSKTSTNGFGFNHNPITKRIDFVGIVTVDGANPNGDPIGDGLPRQDMRGYGEISDVCIKHKVRNQFMQAYAAEDGAFPNNDVLVIDGDYMENRATCIEEKLENKFDGELARILFPVKGKDAPTTLQEKATALCQCFRDIRSFGYVLALKSKEEGAKGTSVGIRGPVTISTAKSVQVIQPITVGITKCISNSEKDKKGSDTMGKKYRVDGAAYVIKGSISAVLAERTGFSEEDAEALKTALIHLFEGDECAARPAGTMTLQSLYWFKHSNKLGQYPVQRVHESVKVAPSEDAPFYQETLDKSLIPGLEVEEYHVNA